MMNTMKHESPLGRLLLVASTRGICGIYFEGQKSLKENQAWQQDSGHPLLNQAARQLDEYFMRRRTDFDLPLDLIGTEFQRAVWQGLMTIPFGCSTSYAELARRIGKPSAARAVGGANGRNPLAIVVPCHRVIGASGALTGYDGGLARKAYLLELEAVAL